jgi:hypothetical protein
MIQSPNTDGSVKIILEGCVNVNPDLANCEQRRGGLFQSNLSSTWSTQGIPNGVDGAIFSLETFEESLLGLDGNGSYGYDTVSFGLPGSNLPTLEKQLIAGIWTDDFFLGNLGISPISFNFTSFNDPQPSMLSSLRNQSFIPSASWGYLAAMTLADLSLITSRSLSEQISPETSLSACNQSLTTRLEVSPC